MDREQVIGILRRHGRELRATGLVQLSLFGSTARGDRRSGSDILLATCDNGRPLSILGVAGMEQRIAEILGHAVELIEEGCCLMRVWGRICHQCIRRGLLPHFSVEMVHQHQFTADMVNLAIQDGSFIR